MTTPKNKLPVFVTLLSSMVFSQLSFSAVSLEESKKLGTELTVFGAIAAGNADGSIPAYDGGLSNPPAVGENNYPDPFSGEQPVLKITKENVSQYEDMLTVGIKTLMQEFPDYTINVYPTHRTMSYPDWFLENTKKNATTAKLVGDTGNTISGGADDGLPFQGVPFPIPQNGYEVMWNNYLRYSAPVSKMVNRNRIVDSTGRFSDLPGTDSSYLHPWSEETGGMRSRTYDAVFGFHSLLTSPPTSAGTQFLTYYLSDLTDTSAVWFYTPGQRRVRRAPEFTYDTPVGAYSGVFVWDEMFGFAGAMDRFDMEIVGLKELFIPYNVFGATNQSTSTEILGEKTLNAEYVRWEKRRVWEVQATRKDNARHAYAKRTFLFEEDSWALVGSESYDDAGNIWRVAQILTFPTWDVGGLNGDTWLYHDLRKGNYLVMNVGRTEPGSYVRSYTSDEDVHFPANPRAVQGQSVR